VRQEHITKWLKSDNLSSSVKVGMKDMSLGNLTSEMKILFKVESL